jgi:NAD(P)-dependent dehydrogenase (short-subunit alcohol dehydrogenase family)
VTPATTTSVCITGSTDGIGLATARLFAREAAPGDLLVVHARSAERGEPVVEELSSAGPGSVELAVGDLADLAQVCGLADRLREVTPGGLDVLVHNAGVWVRGSAPRRSADGHETTFAVNALAPHALTALLDDHLRRRLVFLGSGMAGSGRVRPDALGREEEPSQAYADSKAVDVCLALAWARRRPDLVTAAVDPGWVPTKLATPGGRESADASAAALRRACTELDLPSGRYWKGAREKPVPRGLDGERLQDELLAALDVLVPRG